MNTYTPFEAISSGLPSWGRSIISGVIGNYERRKVFNG
jgi:hypothetical protein